jgi:hypothetical protein
MHLLGRTDLTEVTGRDTDHGRTGRTDFIRRLILDHSGFGRDGMDGRICILP